LQLRRPVPEHRGKIVQIIRCRDPKPPHKVLGCDLEVAIVLDAARRCREIVLGMAKVRVGRNAGGALKALQTVLGFGLGVRVERGAAEELVRRDAFLGAELFAGVAVGVA
jgi:hypothetical protein